MFEDIAIELTRYLTKGCIAFMKFFAQLLFGLATRPQDPTPQSKAVELPPVTTKLKSNHGFTFSNGVAKSETEDGHIMIVGGVGSGKSSCIAIPSLLSWQESVFVIDIKGELYEKTAYQRSNVKVFNPLDNNTIGYDPFYLLRRARSMGEQAVEAKAIAHALIPLPQNVQDPFWIKSAQNLFTGAILHFFNEGYSFIETVEEILSTSAESLIDEIMNSNTKAATHFVNNFSNMKIEQLSSILTEISNQIIVFGTDENIIEALSKEDNISPEDLELGADIYINIPEYMLEQWSGMLALMVNQFITHFEKRADRDSRPILFLLDEFARMGKIEKIVNGLATLRSKNLTICIILQSLAQLDLIYGKDTRRIIADTCQYKAILNVNDVESQEYFSKAVGTYEKIKVVKSQQYKPYTHLNAGSSVSVTTEETARIKLAEFSTLEDIILLTPSGAFKVSKTPYYTAIANIPTPSRTNELRAQSSDINPKIYYPKTMPKSTQPPKKSVAEKLINLFIALAIVYLVFSFIFYFR